MTGSTRESEIPFSYPTFQHAKNFMEGYKLLKLNRASFAVSITNASLALELALKALAGSYKIRDFDIEEEIVDGKRIQSCRSSQHVCRPKLQGKGHELATIFDSVNDNHKRVLELYWLDRYASNSLRDVLDSLSSDFQSSRYLDEANSHIHGGYEVYDALFEMFLSNESILFSG
ncbi:hypothetical protein P2G88_10830 [Aliiglaciecola sp. CAU 1673]|uniref:hypothetical protein n=1 Tax=Aliiglaciecola sp. CAU 1673 TaxID=3032595 RepID=UPI0023DAB74E|nr:hypothetical protein [Aliiglaciecola sp. CAU 1673]MDF2178743.1 hypothetical protein [Aliiglaciecola sp. CAU 1673]